eukprot:scaffold3884_cov18-Tisochrysis_lutea.AAC.1
MRNHSSPISTSSEKCLFVDPSLPYPLESCCLGELLRHTRAKHHEVLCDKVLNRCSNGAMTQHLLRPPIAQKHQLVLIPARNPSMRLTVSKSVGQGYRYAVKNEEPGEAVVGSWVFVAGWAHVRGL